MNNAPRYPVYVISKGRASKPLTAMALTKLGIDFFLVIEPQEYEAYATTVHPKHILTLPFSNLGQGSIPARNWVWEHAKKAEHRRHWILDDNIAGFRRFQKNQRIPVTDGAVFAEAENYVDKFTNIALAGFQYTMFAVTTLTSAITKPFLLNTRIYSCILIDNSIPFRWRGRYNEDTDLSLRVLKAGYCTMLFYAYLCDKQRTMTMAGGNTDELYKQEPGFDGRLEMARSLQRQHPDVTKIIWRWGRWQHSVNYKPFKHNRLIPQRLAVSG